MGLSPLGWGSPYPQDFELPALPSFEGMDIAREAASAIMSEALEMANELMANGVVPISPSIGDVDDVVMPEQVEGLDYGEYSFATVMSQYESYLAQFPDRPTIPSISDTTTERPTIDDPPTIGTITVNDFTESSPILDFGTSPEWSETSPPPTPTIEGATMPDRPLIVYPEIPALGNVDLPSPLSLEIPQFTAIFVEEELVAPSTAFEYNETAYTSALKDAVFNGLLVEVNTGGYGLNPNDEANLWNRERDRELVASVEALEEVRRNFAQSGFPMPTGAMQKALERIAVALMQKNSSVNRDIAVKRADLYWEGKKFAFSSAIQLEQLLMNLHNAMWERALNAAKAEVEMAVALFNALIARYQAKIARYKVEADVFESRIRAEIAKVELYKAQMEGARVQGELQKNQVELYAAQMEGVKNLIEAYKTDVEASNLILQREAIRMQVFKAEVDAYSAQVAAQKYRFDAYESRVKGELGKVQAYEAQARAYAASIEGKKAQVDVNRLLLEQWTQENKALIDIYQLNLAENKEIRDIQVRLVDAEVNLYQADMQGFATKIGGLTKVYDYGQATLERAYRTQMMILQQNIETAKLHLQQLLAVLEAQTKINLGQMESSARIQAAAMNMLNLNASLGHHTTQTMSQSQSLSQSQSYSIGQQYSLSESNIFQFQHVWNHSD